MKLSELIRDYVDLKIEGEPKHSEWSSIDSDYCRREDYRQKLADLEAAIQEIVKPLVQA